MRRALVLTTDSARHPLRQRIAPSGWATDLSEAAVPVSESVAKANRATREDISFFLASFVSFFIIIYGMIV